MSDARLYHRPLIQMGPGRPAGALTLAGGWGWFTHVEVLSRAAPPQTILLQDVPADVLDALTTARSDQAGLSMSAPRIMGILNTTPDSFSDGGLHAVAGDAIDAGVAMQAAGAHILDIGGESTRPGAQTVPVEEEIARTAPVIAGLAALGSTALVSIDTRKSPVAEAALAAGAGLINDVSGFTYDTGLADVAAAQDVPVCVMHALGDPATMQHDPQYEDVVLDVYDFLERQIAHLQSRGIPKARIIADPGIGFGKTLAHNLALLARLGLFHGLGVPILLGASRKRFIGTISGISDASARMPGSLGVALAGLSHGVQILRVHDVPETTQAIALWQAAMTGTQI